MGRVGRPRKYGTEDDVLGPHYGAYKSCARAAFIQRSTETLWAHRSEQSSEGQCAASQRCVKTGHSVHTVALSFATDGVRTSRGRMPRYPESGRASLGPDRQGSRSMPDSDTHTFYPWPGFMRSGSLMPLPDRLVRPAASLTSTRASLTDERGSPGTGPKRSSTSTSETRWIPTASGSTGGAQ